MTSVAITTIEHVQVHLSLVHGHIEKYLNREDGIEPTLDILNSVKEILINVNESILEGDTIDGELHFRIREYIATKLDTIDDIMALELLVQEKKWEYQELLARSSREYEWIKGNSEDLKIRNSYRKRMQKKINETKSYLDHLLDLYKQKSVTFTNKLKEHQNTNREIAVSISNI